MDYNTDSLSGPRFLNED